MKIGIPRERKTLEKRVALTPDGASELTKRGHKVLIEEGAGAGSFFTNDDYLSAGCQVVPTLEAVWSGADLVVKVKEPHEDEYPFFRPGLALFDYLHLASMPDVATKLLESRVTGIAYELVQTEDRRLPLLEPMSEVAGKLSVLNGSYFLLSQKGGRGVLLGGTVGVAPGKVVIIGAGIAGRNACEVALGMGARVTLLDVDYKKLEAAKIQFNNRAVIVHSTRSSLERAMRNADLLIGAVLIPGAAAPRLISREMIASMKQGSVFVDISIDQGGCAETIRPTSLDEPVFVEEGVVHYGVCNMPAQTPRTSTLALTAATLPYIIEFAEHGVQGALEKHRVLRAAVNTHAGHMTNQPCSESLGLPYVPIEEAISAAPLRG
jgi:alanine dehydrogenase